VLDLSASVKLGKNWRLSAGIDNVTNRYPDQVTSAGNLNNNGINPYRLCAERLQRPLLLRRL
jgi:iron complex outermembrane receptor protein